MSCAVDPCEAVTGQSGPDDLVTVVIPCYNGAAYLAEAIQSGLMQSHSSVEVLVIDDGSTDGSPAIAQGYPVRYIRQENRGLSSARNTGIAQSRGQYLVFLDADDRLLPDAIASGLRVLNGASRVRDGGGQPRFYVRWRVTLADRQKRPRWPVSLRSTVAQQFH